MSQAAPKMYSSNVLPGWTKALDAELVFGMVDAAGEDDPVVDDPFVNGLLEELEDRTRGAYTEGVV